ncbi:DegT/DnrJ/EryC1/StrS family aminotransferase [Erwinia sp. S43]|uniref:DegT/DnrJ/EryC1/StrS family aminotransferase n=1 Tax=Erwinia sp. S43 TaxID=2769339 RepID=UPI00190DADC2|nr:DegT/DnrJ/EryC1/StrS family aminotransferase [Erwinia sp. S43]MBK0031952.1 DegT/DnrJ/EryC1/StrS family aminotransferase [Erwinia sp. S43]
MSRSFFQRQLPPTAGLPLLWRDLLPPRADFSDRLAQELGIPPPLLTCSGTAALIIALRTLQQRQPNRHRIIVPAWTCPLVALAAHYCPPLKIVPCDMEYGGINFDRERLAQLCDSQTLAVVVTHYAGRVADTAAVIKIAAAHGTAVIEDAAQSMEAKNAGESVGLAGDIGFFSLAMGKGLTTVEGGVLFSRSAELQKEMERQIARDLPWRAGWELRRIIELWGYRLMYHPDRLDWVYGRQLRSALNRGDAVTAVGDDFTVDDIPLHTLGHYRQRVAASALTRFSAWQQQNSLRAKSRLAELRQLAGVTVLQDGPHQQGVWPFFLLLMPDRGSRDRAMQHLWTAGLGVTRLFIHTLFGYPAVTPLCLPSSIPNAEDFAARSLSISNSHWVEDDDFALIVSVLRAALTT